MRRSPRRFLALLLALSIPFWLIGGLTGLDLLPNLPLSASMFVCPAIAASILVYREGGSVAVSELWKRSFDAGRIRPRIWLVPIVFLMPAATAATYGIMRLAGLPVAAPSWPLGTALGMFLGFFLAGLFEELGWMGYLADPMLERWSGLVAGVLIGLVWAIWHGVPLIQAGRSWEWIAWWSLATVALRVLIVWLYQNTGRSVFGAAVFHAMSNVSGIIFAGYYDPRIIGPILAVTAATVAMVSGPKTLTRSRFR